jgi:hypothetical protein
MDLWSWNNATDAVGTLLSSNTGSAGELLVTNIRDPRVSKVWRAGGMPVQLDIALPATSGVSVVGLFGVNFASVGAVTLRLGTTAGGAELWEETINEDPGVFTRQAVFVLTDVNGSASPVSATHATILAEGGVPLEIGRVWLGGADWQPTRTHTFDGTEWGAEDLSLISRTPRSGSPIGDVGAILRRFTAHYNGLGADDMAALAVMDRRPLLGQMLFVPTPSHYDTHATAILGNRTEIPASQWRTLGIADRSINIMEAG